MERDPISVIFGWYFKTRVSTVDTTVDFLVDTGDSLSTLFIYVEKDFFFFFLLPIFHAIKPITLSLSMVNFSLLSSLLGKYF